MKCGYWYWDPEEGHDPECHNEATHNYNCNVGKGTPVCADHKCRCSITLEEAARRKERQRVPSDWLAL